MFVDSFFKIALGFDDVAFVTIFAWNIIYACVRSDCVVCAFRDVIFLMVCDVVCIIGIPNLVLFHVERFVLCVSGTLPLFSLATDLSLYQLTHRRNLSISLNIPL